MMKRWMTVFVFFLGLLPIYALGQKCHIPDYPHEIECGTFQFKNSITGKIENIAWRRVEARARYPLPDPVIWIPGGLGVGATDRASTVINILSRLKNSRDLIWIDIYGSGNSSPLLCAKPSRSIITEKFDIFSNSHELQNCYDEITKRGGMHLFSYQQFALHYEQLRQHLKLGKVNVIADGVGGNIALAWSNLAPYAMNSLVLDSPPPLDQDATIQRAKSYARILNDIIESCKNDIDCRKHHPDSEFYLNDILKNLPKEITLTNPHTALKEQLMMNQELFAQMLMSILRTPARAAALPNVLHAASEDNWQPIIGLGALSWAKSNTKFSNGLWLASLCANGHASPDIQLTKTAQWFYVMQKKRLHVLCDGKWEGKANYTIPKGLPVLVFSPLADPYSTNTLTTSKNIRVIRVPGASSGVLSLGCARDIVYRFIEDKKYQLNDKSIACLTNLPLPVVGPVNRFGRAP